MEAGNRGDFVFSSLASLTLRYECCKEANLADGKDPDSNPVCWYPVYIYKIHLLLISKTFA